MKKKKIIIGIVVMILVIIIVYYMYTKHSASSSKTVAPNVTAWINSMNTQEKALWTTAINSWFTQADLDNLSQAVQYFSSNTMMPGPLTDWWNTTATKVG